MALKSASKNADRSYLSAARPDVIKHTDLLAVQLESARKFFHADTPTEDKPKEGLYKIFNNHFPISDSKGHFKLEFLDYNIELPRYSPSACMERGISYTAPLKLSLRLSCHDTEEEEVKTVEQEVFLGNIPYMTPSGSFVINGVERVIVSQIRRSPGVFFTKVNHFSGVKLYSAKVIPAHGSWIELITDPNGILYTYVDRRKKFLVTVLLRSIGFGTDRSILSLFDLADKVPVKKNTLKKHIGSRLAERILRTWVEEFVDEDTGEVIAVQRNKVVLDRDSVITEDNINIILEHGQSTVFLQKTGEQQPEYAIVYNTLKKDDTNSEKEAIDEIYRQLRGTEPPDEQSAREVVHNTFFSNQRYDLGQVGRYTMNSKLGLSTPQDVTVLTKDDILHIIKHLIRLINTRALVDDIDHLSNRRVSTVGEQIAERFNIALTRMSRAIKERMREDTHFRPSEMVNSRAFSSIINAYFNTSPLSQPLDEVNCLANLSHKRKISALGDGGVDPKHAGFEIRDINFSQYGRLCVAQTPEGPNIGLISSLCIHAKVNDLGFIETPYRKVSKGRVDLKNPVRYLTAEQETGQHIAQASVAVDKQGNLIDKKVKVRMQSDFPVVEPEQVNYIDLTPDQIVGLSAGNIPFLEHDDATRTLMGSNMQCQAVPLLIPEAPIVGTGLEKRVIQESRLFPIAEQDGVVEYVDANKIVIQYTTSKNDAKLRFGANKRSYELTKFKGTNQKTCINLRPVVTKRQKLKKGQPLCEGFSSKAGELALGRNLRVAFMPFKGYNFEDGIVISDRVVKDDLFTSIHIEKFELPLRNTKLGEEEFTADIPNTSEDSLKNLDEDGIVRVGSRVREGDIIVGKVAPKGRTDVTAEEKLLRAIFGDKAYDVKDVSLKAPPAFDGIVIATKLFQKPERSKEFTSKVKKDLRLLEQFFTQRISDLREQAIQKLAQLLEGCKSSGVCNRSGRLVVAKDELFTREILEDDIFSYNQAEKSQDKEEWLQTGNPLGDLQTTQWTEDKVKNQQVNRLLRNYKQEYKTLFAEFKRNKFDLEVGDELPEGMLKLARVYIARKRKLKVGDKMAGRHGDKGTVALIAPEEDMPFLEDGTRIDIVRSPLGLPSRMNLGQLLEGLLGWAGASLGKRYASPVFKGASLADIQKELRLAGLPEFGRATLNDGITGQKLDYKVTCGVVYMLRLNHSVEDKMHARSIGPYSRVTQQPMGGKSHFGGQRVGEMEIWGFEGFGASYNILEMLTLKSDDVVNRIKTYNALAKGYELPEPGSTEAFKILRHHLRGLCVDLGINEPDREQDNLLHNKTR